LHSHFENKDFNIISLKDASSSSPSQASYLQSGFHTRVGASIPSPQPPGASMVTGPGIGITVIIKHQIPIIFFIFLKF
jgi:hypothetical protein